MTKNGKNTKRKRNSSKRINFKFISKILLVPLIIFFTNKTSCLAESITNIAELPDVFPFSRYHLSTTPTSAELTNQGEIELTQQLLISNSYTNELPSYLVDIEQYSLISSIKYGYSENLEIGAKFNIDWQGGGSLDHSIYQWHDLFGLPQGGRDKIEDNQYAIAYQNKDDQSNDINAEGYNFGNISLATKYQLADLQTKNSNTIIHSILLLPLATDYYQQDGFDLAIGPVFQYQANSFTFTSGLYYTYLNDSFEDGITFNHHQVSSFINFDIPLCSSLSLTTSLWGASSAVQNVPRLPDYQTYWDIALAFPLAGSNFIVGFRENPVPDDGTTDITFFLQMSEKL